MKKLFFITCIISFQKISAQQSIVKPSLFVYDNASLQQNAHTITVQPLQRLALTNAKGSNIKVFDGDGREYFSSPSKLIIHFTVGGSLGKQTIRIYNQNKIVDSLSFYVDAKTNIDDGGYYKKMFNLFYNGMFADSKKGTFPIEWNGKTYHVFVPWILDNYQTMKGVKYFMPNGKILIDIMRQSQRDDGMIYSYIQYQHNIDYFLTRDKFSE